MIRQVRLATLATLAMSNGFASGQARPAAPVGSPSSGGPVYVMKTAGQPERRVQVLKSEAQPDGTILTDVKDLATGTIYSLTNPAVLGKAIPHTEAKPAAVVAKPAAPAPGTPRPLFGQFPNQRVEAPRERLVPAEQTQQAGPPQARDRKVDPLLAGANTPAALAARTPPREPASTSWKPGLAAPASIAARTPLPSKSSNSEPPSVLGKMFGDAPKPTPVPRVGGGTPAPTVAALPNPVAPIVMPSVAQATVPSIAPVSMPLKSVETAPLVVGNLAVPAIEPNAKPSAATGIFDSQPATAPTLPTVAIPAIQPAPMPEAVSVPPIAIPIPSVAIPTPAVAVEPTPAVAVPSEPAELPNDVRIMIDDLKNHKRPTFRMENATALAESAHAKNPAVTEALLHAAANDKTGVVRGHCIAQLADVGCVDAGYLKSLDSWASDREPAVRRAAVAAKAKLGR